MMGKLTKELRERLDRLSTTNVSDALDALGLKGSTYGVNKMYEGCEKIIGEAVTMKVVAAGLTKSTTHMGVNAIEAANEGRRHRHRQWRAHRRQLLGRRAEHGRQI